MEFSWRRPLLSPDELRFACECALAVSIPERQARIEQLQLDYPQVLIELAFFLAERWETSPAVVRDEAEFFYHLVEKKPKFGMGLLNEREQCLGDFAMIAGVACRLLSRREEARLWFDRAEMWFVYEFWGRPDLLRLAYQKLALRLEERQFTEVAELLPPLIERLEDLRMRDDSLKARFLEACVLKESDRLDEASARFREISREALEAGNGRLVGSAYGNLLQIHAFRGEAEKAFDLACEATPILRQVGNRIALAKLQWGLGYLLRKQEKLGEAIEAYRLAQQEFAEIEMQADVAAIHLVIADLLLELGQEAQARWEIQAALPAIDEYKLVPEGVAALSLLRQSLQGCLLNRQALRDLHGYFRDDR